MRKNIFSMLILVIMFSCKPGDSFEDIFTNEDADLVWLVDTTLMTGTKIRNTFPLVTRPVYKSAKDVSGQNLSEKAVVFKIDDTVFIFPFVILSAEVINGTINNTYFAVSYCPKTNTTYVFNRNINGKVYTFKASGLLYQDNLVFYDLETESLWSQLYFKCIKGAHLRKTPQLFNSFETTLDIALQKFPEAKVFVDYPGFTPSFEIERKSVTQNDDMVMGILDHKTKPTDLTVVNYNQLKDNGILDLKTHIVVYNKEFNYINAFLHTSGLTFEVKDSFPDILIDNEGNTWDVFGVATKGPRKGKHLTGGTSFLAYWWAWKGIYNSFNHVFIP